MPRRKKEPPPPPWMTEFLRAESYGYVIVSSDYIQKLELLAKAATAAYFDPNAEYDVEDALKILGRI